MLALTGFNSCDVMCRKFCMHYIMSCLLLCVCVAMETAVLEEKHHNNKKCAELEEVVSRLQVDIDKIGIAI